MSIPSGSPASDLMTPGRPTSYKPEYCDLIVGWGESGKSIVWMAAQLNVVRDTIYEWAKVHPEFSDSLTRARLKCQAWWEDQGQAGLAMPGFNGSVWAKNMGARFKDDWSEKNTLEVSGPNGGPVSFEKIERVIVRPPNSNT